MEHRFRFVARAKNAPRGLKEPVGRSISSLRYAAASGRESAGAASRRVGEKREASSVWAARMRESGGEIATRQCYMGQLNDHHGDTEARRRQREMKTKDKSKPHR